MQGDLNFFVTSMPESRKADYYLGCLDGSVFFDFNQSNENLISLSRISFDGYGCCDLGQNTNQLNYESSNKFLQVIKEEKLNQKDLTKLVKELIDSNVEYIWLDALEEYGLIDKP